MKGSNGNEVLPTSDNEVMIRSATDDDEESISAIFNEANSLAVKDFIEKTLGPPLRFGLLGIALIIVGVFVPQTGSLVFYGYLSVLIAAIMTYFPVVFYTLHSALDKDFQKGIVKYYSHDRHCMLVAEVNKVVVGMIGIKPANTETAGHFYGMRKDGDAELSRMAVSKMAMGRGISKLLLKAAKAYCEEHEYARMILTTSTAQEVACVHLYPSFGFKVERRYNVKLYGGLIDSVFFSYPLENKQK